MLGCGSEYFRRIAAMPGGRLYGVDSRMNRNRIGSRLHWLKGHGYIDKDQSGSWKVLKEL